MEKYDMEKIVKGKKRMGSYEKRGKKKSGDG